MTLPAEQPAALVDGQPAQSLPLDDRGLLYGDGLFETMAFSGGRCALWRWHMKRLGRGSERLGLATPRESTLQRECLTLAGEQSCVLRLTVTRGSSLKPGYGVTGEETARRIVVRLPRPRVRPLLRVGICQGRLPSPGPASGLKHLSRLDQVLLAREIAGTGWDEGLLLDEREHLCEALQSNVLLLLAGRPGWVTPPVGAGVAGACRAALLDHELVQEQPVCRRDLDRCVALALSNAVRGVEPVGELVGLGTLDPAPAVSLAAAFDRALGGRGPAVLSGGKVPA